MYHTLLCHKESQHLHKIIYFPLFFSFNVPLFISLIFSFVGKIVYYHTFIQPLGQKSYGHIKRKRF